MEGVCIMLDEKPDWPTAKKVLGDSQFLNNLKTYDKDNIPEPTIKKLQKYINDENMQVAVVERVSTAAKGLCMWLHAMNVYHKVAKEVGPKRAKVAELTAQLEAANAELQEKRDNLAAVVAIFVGHLARAQLQLRRRRRRRRRWQWQHQRHGM